MRKLLSAVAALTIPQRLVGRSSSTSRHALRARAGDTAAAPLVGVFQRALATVPAATTWGSRFWFGRVHRAASRTTTESPRNVETLADSGHSPAHRCRVPATTRQLSRPVCRASTRLRASRAAR